MTQMPDPSAPPLPRLQLRLIFDAPDGNGVSFGPGKAELLAQIAAQGSIAAAGRAMGMSYKRAWDLVEEMNALFRAPLVVTERGGAGRGGARVTAEGQAILARYRHLVAVLAEAGAADLAAISAGLAPQDGLPAQKDPDMFGKT